MLFGFSVLKLFTQLYFINTIKIEIKASEHKHRIIKELPKSTVHCVKAQLVLLNSKNEIVNLKEQNIFSRHLVDQIEMGQEIYRNEYNKWQNFDEFGIPLNAYTHKDIKKNFFFTAPMNGVYEFGTVVRVPDQILTEAKRHGYRIFLDITELIGRDNDANIVSKADTVLYRFKNAIDEIISTVRLSISVLTDKKYGDAFFRDLSDSLIKTVIFVILLKVTIITISIFLAHRSIKMFFRQMIDTNKKR